MSYKELSAVMTTLPMLKFHVMLLSTPWLFVNTANAQDACFDKIPTCRAKFGELRDDITALSATFNQLQSINNIEQLKSSIAMLNQTLQSQAMEMSNKQPGYKYNIAEGKPTSQCSVSSGGDSARAVDNVWLSTFSSKSCTHTNKETSPWWYVDLQNRYIIYSVVIQNREDCCWDRLYGATILVGDSLVRREMHTCGTFREPSFAGEIREIKCFPPVTGRYLKIQLPGTGYLTLCEVAVYDAFQRD